MGNNGQPMNTGTLQFLRRKVYPFQKKKRKLYKNKKESTIYLKQEDQTIKINQDKRI